MLIISRREDEAIFLSVGGIDIKVTICRLIRGDEGGGKRVKLGIEAPNEVTVLRNELWHEQNGGVQPAEKKVDSSSVRNRSEAGSPTSSVTSEDSMDPKSDQ